MGQAWCKEKTTKAQDSKSPLDRVFVRCAHRIYPGLKDEGSVLGGATQRVTSSEIGYAGSPPRHVLARGRSVDSVDRPFQPSDWVDVNLEAPSTPREAFGNLTLDRNLYPASPASNHSKDAVPIPPPRRRKQRNKDRPLPPKPDEAAEEPEKLKRVDTNEEPFYTSVKPPQLEETTTGQCKDLVDGQPARVFAPRHEDRRSKEIYEHKVNGTGRIIPSDVVSGRRPQHNVFARNSDQRRRSEEVEEYERFARSRSVDDASTPNHRDTRVQGNSAGKQGKGGNRPKNYSTASLPNYDELGVDGAVRDESPEETSFKRPVRNSTGSLPLGTCQVSKSHFEDSVMKEEVDEDGFVKYDPKKLEDWDFSDVSNCGSHHRQRSFQSSPMSEIVGESVDIDKQFEGKDSTGRNQRENAADGGKGKSLSAGDPSFPGGEVRKSSALEKPEAFGKTPLPDETDGNSMFSKNVDDWIAGHNRYFEPPTLKETCKASAADEKKSFFLVEQNPRASTENCVEETYRNGGLEKPANFAASGRFFERRLSNESEPFEDSYEEKDLPHMDATIPSKLVKAISEESLPREMLEENEEDFFAEKLSKDARNELTKDSTGIPKTPSPSPEPRIKAEILDNDHSILLKVLKDEAAEESNLSSMTPSLTELEAALSDMLEKDGAEDEVLPIPATEIESQGHSKVSEKPIEPSIVPVAKSLKDDSAAKNLVDDRKDDHVANRKVSFCAWEEIDLADTRQLAAPQEDSKVPQTIAEEPPEKPSRLHAAESIPMPPRRKNRSNPGAAKDPENAGTSAQNDRLI